MPGQGYQSFVTFSYFRILLNHYMKTIRLIGYWKSEFEMELPHPINFVDSNWDINEKTEVIQHIKNAHFLPSIAAGYSYCRLCDKTDNGCRAKSDGKYIWPEGFLHYIEEHNVRPPQEFIDNCLKNSTIPPVNWEQEIKIDNEWWQSQHGEETPESKSFIDPYEHTYPKFFLIQLTDFDKTLLKLEYRKFLKEISNKLGFTVSQMHQKLNNEDNTYFVSEDTAQELSNLKDQKLFLNIKLTSKAPNRIEL